MCPSYANERNVGQNNTRTLALRAQGAEVICYASLGRPNHVELWYTLKRKDLDQCKLGSRSSVMLVKWHSLFQNKH